MVKKENGYAMVIALIVLIVMFLLGAALTTLINGEISLSSNNYKRINAKYNAETGIEDSILQIKTTSVDNITNGSSDGDWNQGSYSYTIYPPGDSGYSDLYKIVSTGVYDNNNKLITVLLSDGGPDSSFIFGNQFLINNTDIENVDISDHFDTFSGYKQIDPDKITDLYREVIVFLYDYDNDGAYGDEVEDTNDDNVPENYSVGPVDSNVNVIDQADAIISVNGTMEYPVSSVYHYRGDLTYEGQNQGNTAIQDEVVSNDIPPVIIVDGDLNFDSIRGINNVIFIVGGSVNVALRSAQMDMQNTFLYIQEDFGMAKDVGNPNQNPHIDFYGQIIVENNIDINIKTSNDAAYKQMLWPVGFDHSNFSSLYEVGFNLVSWIE